MYPAEEQQKREEKQVETFRGDRFVKSTFQAIDDPSR
jgi:hypothetical protein